VSFRRRPITSPPGRPSCAFFILASNGPAKSSDARISPASFCGTSTERGAPLIRTVCGSSSSTVAPSARAISSIPRTSRIRGRLRKVTGSSVSRLAAMSGSASFLLPAGVISPRSGVPPSTLNRAIGPEA
jgi:hypothetical protein